MKKKFMPIIAAVATMVVAGLAACGPKDDPSVTPPASSVPTPGPSNEPEPGPSNEPEPGPTSNTPEVVHVSSVSVTAEKTTLFVDEETQVSVSVLPENADDKTYVLASSEATVASVDETGKVVALQAGKTTITATATDGGVSGSVEIEVKAKEAPKLVLPEVTEYSVAVDEVFTLPSVTASNYKGEDMTSSIEVSDLNESGTINEGKFTAKIAGVHTLSYYVYDENGEDEQFLTINVTPANEENFEVGENNDPAKIAEYGVYKENFAKGKNNKLGVQDANGASYLYGGVDAIAGNSLIIDAHKTGGSAANQVFLMGFNDYFVRGKSATYSVSFDYKILSNPGNLGDFYLQLGWDGFDGANRNFVNTKAEVGTVQHYEVELTGSIVPLTGNAWFSFFKLGGSEAKIAIDNLVFASKKEVQTTAVLPTSDELMAEGGFTWNMSDKGCTITSGKAIDVNDADASVKEAMKASDKFGDVVMHLTGADSHLFSGLTKDNMIPGKILTIEMHFAAVNKNGSNLIMMGSAGNPTLTNKVTTNEDGTYTMSWEGKILDGWNQLNIYGASNRDFSIYVGSIKAVMKDAPVPVTPETPNGHKVGEKWSYDSRQFGAVTDGNRVVADYDGNADAVANAAMGTSPKKVQFLNQNITIEWFRAGGKIEPGMQYKISCDYYVAESNNGRLMYNIDNGVFELVGPSSVGYHHGEWNYTSGTTADFVSFFSPGGDGFVGTFYVNAITVELVKIN